MLAVLSAILFGIWAPVSYRLQDLGNKSNDVSQTQLMQKIERMGSEVEGLKRQMERVALLRAWEFCMGEERERLPACRAMLKENDVNALIADLVPVSPKTTTPQAASVTSLPLSPVISKTIASRVASTIATPFPENSEPTRIPENDGPQHDELDDDYPGVFRSLTASSSNPTYTIPPCGGFRDTSTVPCSVDQPHFAPSSFVGLRFKLLFLGVLLGGFVLVQIVQRRRRRNTEVERCSEESAEQEILVAKRGIGVS